MNALLLEHFLHRNKTPTWVLGQKRLYNILIFALEQRAGRVDQSSAFFHQTARRFENTLLNVIDAVELFGRKPPFEIRIAAQRARPGAGGIHEHAVKFISQTAHARIRFALNSYRMNIRKAGTAHTRRKTGETFFIDVKGIETSR